MHGGWGREHDAAPHFQAAIAATAVLVLVYGLYPIRDLRLFARSDCGTENGIHCHTTPVRKLVLDHTFFVFGHEDPEHVTVARNLLHHMEQDELYGGYMQNYSLDRDKHSSWVR